MLFTPMYLIEEYADLAYALFGEEISEEEFYGFRKMYGA